ncbi:FecR family protein [Chitinophaga varians]|uniref:FecR family protein n=1 Tax=Chitinophaga varians TaxID=2202339 RepID=UPI00165EC994|nr:FecR domain-containing protein [Chitinophaga varians]MBC9914425.1 FecR domain-containing protein [Chitinophaga varians]
MMELPDNIKAIIVNRIRGVISPEEEQMLREWEREYAVEEEALDSYDKIWTESSNIISQSHFDTAKGWQRLDQRLKGAGMVEEPVVRKVGLRRYWGAAAAAAAAMVIIIAGYWMFFRSAEPQQITWSKVVTADATNKYLRLPDSTLVLLRKGATITYSTTFGESDRLITLTGDAFFDVAAKENIPFRIQTERAMVKVLGTSFVVNATPGGDRVVVVTGKVLLTDKARPENKCIVSAKEQVSFAGDSFEKKNVNDSNYLAWQTGILRFTNTPLKEVVKELSTYYGTAVNVNDTLKAGSVKVTASFREQPLNEVLEEITVITGLRYRKQQDSIIIY